MDVNRDVKYSKPRTRESNASQLSVQPHELDGQNSGGKIDRFVNHIKILISPALEILSKYKILIIGMSAVVGIVYMALMTPCAAGFKRSAFWICEDDDECIWSPCNRTQQCVNLMGSYKCVCDTCPLNITDSVI